MEQKKDRKLLKRIGSIVGAIALTIVAFSLPFLSKFDSNLNAKHFVAHADEVTTGYEFNGSSIVTVSSSILEGVGYALGFFNFEIDLNNYSGYISADVDFKYYYSGIGYGSVVKSHQVQPSSSSTYQSYTGIVTGTNRYFSYAFACDDGFNCFVKKVRIYSEESMLNSNTKRIYTYINYYDENDKIFSVRIPCDVAGENSYVASYFLYTDRYYYLVGTFMDDDKFKEGYESGYVEGSNAGYDNGYSAGSKAGETIGYNNGYQAGANAAGEYTFFGLVSAVIDAPIQAFISLFNFELLGINLAGFFTGLFTLAFIITIVRLVMP